VPITTPKLVRASPALEALVPPLAIATVPDSCDTPIVLFVSVCVPVSVATVESIAISSALAVIPAPPTTLSVTSPDVPPPVRPSPAYHLRL
jgi:hypothetical protein